MSIQFRQGLRLINVAVTCVHRVVRDRGKTNRLSRDHAEVYYRRDANHVGSAKRLIRIVREPFGMVLAKQFALSRVKTVRITYIAKGWVRSKIDEVVGDVIAVLSLGVDQEMVPGQCY